jgi:hypothetical protein
MFEIVRTYADGSERIVLPNLTEEQADAYMANAITSGNSPVKGDFTDQKRAKA